VKKLTDLGKAIRHRDAGLASGWERDYGAAIEAARAGDMKRLLNLLRAHRPLGDGDFDALAGYLETTAKHGHRQRDASVHLAARVAETIMDANASDRVPASVRERAIEIACKQVERETGEEVDAERVRDLLRRPRKRRYSAP
jgi:hypothetical protein